MATNDLDNRTERSKLHEIWDNSNSLLIDFEKLFNNPSFSDILFIIGENERQFKAHSLILKTRCLRFQSENIMDTPMYKQHWRSDVFENVLKYIYTGKVNYSFNKYLRSI